MRKVFGTLSRARRKFQKNRHPCWTSARRRGNEEWQHHHWKAVDAVINCKKREYTSVARRWPHEAPYRNTQTYLGWSLEYCPFLDHLKTIQITCNATQGERLRYRNDFMLQWENPTNPGIMSIHEKFRDAVKTTYNDGSSRTRVHLHPSTGKDLTTSHWLATTLSTPSRVQTMESCPWNSGAIVIVFVNDLVEFATLGKSSTVAKVANEPQLGKSQLCQTRGQDSGNSRYWVRNLFQGFCGAWQGSKQQPDQIICDLRFGLACRKQSKTKKSKNALSRRQKLDNARKLTEKLHRSRRRRIWRISQNEARKKLETPLEPPLPCKMATRKRVRSYGKLCSRIYKEAFGIYSSEKSRRSHRRERERESSILLLITMWCINLFQYSKRWKFWMRRRRWIRNGRSSRKFLRGRWIKWRARRMLFF